MSGCDCRRLFLACLLLLTAAKTALAQSSRPGDAVALRERAVVDGEPTGVQAGSFIISPGIELSSRWDDNILRTHRNPKTDIITEAKPAVGIQTNWDRHVLFLGAEGEFGTYADNSHLDYSDYAFLASGQYDITYETSVIAGFSQLRRHEDREALSTPAGIDPISYTVNRAQMEFKRALGMIKLNIAGWNEDVSFEDEIAAGRNTSDRHNQTLQATVSYDYMPGNGFFIKPTWSTADYSLAGGASATSDGGDIRAGWNFHHPRGLDVSLFSGYLYRDYETGMDNTGDFYVGGTLDWDITRLTTLSFTLDKNFYETSVTNAAGSIQTKRQIKVETDITPFVIGEIGFGVDDNEYVGGGAGVDRKTTLYYGDFGAKYELSDHVGVRFGVRHEERKSPVANDEYENTRAMISLVYAY